MLTLALLLAGGFLLAIPGYVAWQLWQYRKYAQARFLLHERTARLVFHSDGSIHLAPDPELEDD